MRRVGQVLHGQRREQRARPGADARGERVGHRAAPPVQVEHPGPDRAQRRPGGEPLHDPGQQQRAEPVGRDEQHRRHRLHGQPGQQHRPPSRVVGHPAERQQARQHRQRVHAEHHRRRQRREPPLPGIQRVHRRRRRRGGEERDHDRAEQYQRQRAPPPAPPPRQPPSRAASPAPWPAGPWGSCPMVTAALPRGADRALPGRHDILPRNRRRDASGRGTDDRDNRTDRSVYSARPPDGMKVWVFVIAAMAGRGQTWTHAHGADGAVRPGAEPGRDRAARGVHRG